MCLFTCVFVYVTKGEIKSKTQTEERRDGETEPLLDARTSGFLCN